MVAARQIKKAGRGPNARVSWLAPLPVWARPGPAGLRARDGGQPGRPAILRYDHDEFMAEFVTTLQSEPLRLGEWLARPETWRAPMAAPKKPAPTAQSSSRAAFLFEKTRRLTAALKPAPAATALNLQPQPPPAPAAEAAITEELLPLKLYQASHSRHYLVTASLVSQEPGLPDLEPETGRSEKTAFVVRRLLPPADNAEAPLARWDEYAFVPENKKSSWRRIGSRNTTAVQDLIAGEEQFPLFPVTFTGSCGAARRVLAGVIPVSRREKWVGAAIGGDVTAATPAGDQARPGRTLAGLLLQADVAAPWKLLLERTAFKTAAADRNFPNFDSDDAARDADRQRMVRTARDEIQTGSWYVLLDFAQLLHDHLPSVFQALTGAKSESDLTAGEQELVAVLRATTLSWELARTILTHPYLFPYPDWPTPAGLAGLTLSADTRYGDRHLAWNLADALVRAKAGEPGLEAVQVPFIRFAENGDRQAVDSQWPAFLFPLADPELAFPVPAVAETLLAGLSGLERQQAAVDELARMIEALLPPAPAAEELMETLPTGDLGRAAWFVVRCVYERPLCGPMFTTLVSTATRAFQTAPFFDPDAPARPVRIPMPADISVAGLRKYQKNTGFVISDMLCGKIKAIRKMTLADLVLSVLPWPFHKDLPDPGKTGPCEKGGTICSLSIPIVTLCALILMMIIVALFDLFFHWIPYLFICLPIPGLKGKKNGEG
jgi:hypothetical protein